MSNVLTERMAIDKGDVVIQHIPALDGSPTNGLPGYFKTYGISGSSGGELPWTWATERLARAAWYWIGSTRPDGRPHAKPVWGVWANGRLYLDNNPKSRSSRNLAVNPAVVVHVESGPDVVIVEGTASPVTDLDQEAAERIAEAFATKYAAQNYHPTPAELNRGGLNRIQPNVVLGWSSILTDGTRWTFWRE
jgi:nitroimidazol reductase NimA-like FMN-containing flavoprotein (pyridoxamine 5'-phosphate oxidase superfamily)